MVKINGMDANDHDLLIQLNTKVELLLSSQAEFIRTSNSAITGLSERIAALETKDSRDSEKVRAISEDVQRSLNNRERITSLETQLADISKDIDSMRTKSNVWDIINSVGIAIGTIVGYLAK